MRSWHSWVLATAVALGACDARVDDDQGPAADRGVRLDGGRPVDGGDAPDGGQSEFCPPPDQRNIENIPADTEISESEVWRCDTIYRLLGRVFVYSADGPIPTLTIERGTVIQGVQARGLAGSLIVTRRGRISAEGTPADPIIFTSARPPTQRRRGDWGGVALIGRATVTQSENRRFVEGLGRTRLIDEDNPGAEVNDEVNFTRERINYGPEAGTQADEGHDCGTLRYVRIEFTGVDAGGVGGNEIQGLTIAGCGFQTEIDYVQVHESDDDGVEVFGGAVDLKHIVLSGADDDSLDWDDGWTGRVQYLLIQHRGSSSPNESRGFEGDARENSDDTIRDPQSLPRIFNATIVGSAESGDGMRLRDGTGAYIRNAIIANWPDGPIDIGGENAARNTTAVVPTLTIQHSLFFAGPDGAESQQSDSDDGDLINENTFFLAEGQNNERADPGLDDAVYVIDGRPVFQPAPGSRAATGGEAPSEIDYDPPRPAFFDEGTTFIGGVDPSGDDWSVGWTSFPND